LHDRSSIGARRDDFADGRQEHPAQMNGPIPAARSASFFPGTQWLAVLLLIAHFFHSHAHAEAETVAVTGMSAPDSAAVANGLFDTFAGIPVLNSNGLAVFLFRLANATGGFTTTPTGIWTGGTGASLKQIVRQADATTNGIVGSLSGQPVLNNSGTVSFQAALNDTSGGFGVDDLAVFSRTSGGLAEIVRLGQPAVNGDGSIAAVGTPAMNNSNLNAVLISYGDTASGLPERAIITGSGGAFTQIARERAAADGGGTFSRLFIPSVSDLGTVAFRANVTGGTGSDGVFFSTNGGPVTKIARATEPSPDSDGYFFTFNTPLTNRNGEIAFRAVMSSMPGNGVGTEEALFVRSAGNLIKVARNNDLAPGGRFEGSFNFALNNAGTLGFVGSIDAGPTSFNGVYRGSGGPVTEITRQGNSAAGVGTFLFFDDPAINDSNVVAFQAGAELTPGGGAAVRGIYLGDGENLIEVVRTGQALAGGTVNEFNFAGGDNDLGGGNGLNNFGQVAYQARLDTTINGRQGVFIFTPELHWRRTQSTGAWDIRDNWTLGLAPGLPHDVFLDPPSNVTVTGPSASVTVESLKIGGASGHAKLVTQPAVTISASEQVIVDLNGVLSGGGTIAGALTARASGVIAPGNTVGTLAIGNLTAESGSVLQLEINGTNAGLFDQLAVNGTVNLGGIIQLILGFAPAQNASLVVLENDGSDAVTGMFSNGPVVSAQFNSQTYFFEVNYAGGTGNDVVLNVIPEPSAGLLLAIGLMAARHRPLNIKLNARRS
jgi:hypothetical protein